MQNPAFTKALVFMLANEGGYSNSKKDRGGETIFGISRRMWPTWKGWKLIDMKKPEVDITELKDNPDFMNLIEDFYFNNFWVKIKGQEILRLAGESIAIKVFDTAVNIGVSKAICLLQEAINSCKSASIDELKPDGIIGPKTLNALRIVDATILLTYFIKELKAYYGLIVNSNPSQAIYSTGWKLRAERTVAV